jgi:hypothetical protein
MTNQCLSYPNGYLLGYSLVKYLWWPFEYQWLYIVLCVNRETLRHNLHTLRPMSCTNSMDMPPLYTFLGPGTCRVMVSLNAVIVMSKQWSNRDGPWSTPAFNHCLLYRYNDHWRCWQWHSRVLNTCHVGLWAAFGPLLEVTLPLDEPMSIGEVHPPIAHVRGH